MNTFPNILLGWSEVGSMDTPRGHHTASLLTNGTVLVTGGISNTYVFSSSELYDPSTRTWTLSGSMNYARYYHTASVLTNGKVLVVGGIGRNVQFQSKH